MTLRRVLSLDGGGVRGRITLGWLMRLEDMVGSLQEHFDLIVGTSTGGIIATGLAAGMRCGEILDAYKEMTGSVFGKPRGFVSRLFRPKYDARRLHACLLPTFGGRRMLDSVVPYMVTAYNLSQRRASFFKSFDGSENHLYMHDVAAATASAPTFFKPMKIDQDLYVDGGVFMCNPVVSAYAEARRMWPALDIDVVSVGTGKQSSIEAPGVSKGGMLSWAASFPRLSLDGVADVSEYQIASLIRPEDRYFRIDCTLPERIEMDDASEEAGFKMDAIAAHEFERQFETFSSAANSF